eukprot:SAG22_NODE_69_length_22779_cov_71.088139_16_plen_82_part_00
MTLGDSQLVGADGSADPFPCDGALPDCVGVHAGSVVVEGMAAVTLASPLVCDGGAGRVCTSVSIDTWCVHYKCFNCHFNYF